MANRQPVKITANIYSELTVQGARATTRAKMFCMHCSLLMFACDIPYSTLLSPVYTIQPVVKPVVKLKEREPLYLTLMTGLFFLYDSYTAGCQTGCTTGLTTGCIV